MESKVLASWICFLLLLIFIIIMTIIYRVLTVVQILICVISYNSHEDYLKNLILQMQKNTRIKRWLYLFSKVTELVGLKVRF